MKRSAAEPNSHRNNNRNRGHGEKLTRKANAAIAALLSNGSTAEAARAAGVSQTTLWRWLQRDDFRRQLQDAQQLVFDTSLTTLQGSLNEAVNCLRRNLNCKSPAVQVQASKLLIEYSLRLNDTVKMEARVRELEDQMLAREQADQAQQDLIALGED